jgi:hypothetical protein
MHPVLRVAPLCLVCHFPSVVLGSITFQDVSVPSGVRAADVAANSTPRAEDLVGDTLPWGHRIAWADVTGDGLPDLFVGRWPCMLLANNGDGTFTDISDVSGYRAMDDYAIGGVAFDMENDGDRDWFAAGNWDVFPDEAEVLGQNDGVGNFVDVVSASTAISGSPGQGSSGTRGVGAADFDNDGWLDLVSMTTSKEDSANSHEHVFWNNGTGTYTTATTLSAANVKNQGCQTIDFDHDGDMDIYANRRVKRNHLYRNDGGRQFAEMAEEVGLDLNDEEADDGAAWGDVDNDGDLDVLCGGRILGNDGSGHFTQFGSYANGSAYCCGIADLDNDGDLDFVVPTNVGPAVVYENDGSGTFAPLGDAGLTWPGFDRRSIGFADYDGDGLLDVAFADKSHWNSLFRNGTQDAGNWIKVQLRRASGQIDAIGSFVWAYPAGEVGNPSALLGMRHAEGATGYTSMHDPVMHFGLGAVDVVDLRIRFPGGILVDALAAPAGQTVVITETGTPPSVGVDPWVSRREGRVVVFPNPFRSRTTISFSNPSRSASICIHDVQGRIVAAFDGVTQERIDWNAGTRASGVYFVKIRTGERVFSKKITRID